MFDPQVNMCLNPGMLTLLLQVTLPDIKIDADLKKAKVFEGKCFQPKAEYHITIISKPIGEKLNSLAAGDPNFLHKLIELIKNTSWLVGNGTEFSHVVKDKGDTQKTGEADQEIPETIIVGVPLSGIEAFYNGLSELAGETIAPPYYTHVTLFTYRNEHGIRVSTKQEFDDYVKREINLDELQAL